MDSKKSPRLLNAEKTGCATCSKCKKEKPIYDFYTATKNNWQTLQSWCVDCLKGKPKGLKRAIEPGHRTWTKTEGTPEQRRKQYKQREKQRLRDRLNRHIEESPCDCCKTPIDGFRVYWKSQELRKAVVCCSWSCMAELKARGTIPARSRIKELEEGEVLK